jgi:hypothetical protein
MTEKVVQLDQYRKGVTPIKATCDFHAVSNRTGKPIHGVAAMLQTMGDHGGPDQFLHKAVELGVTHALNTLTETSGMGHKKAS